MQIAMNLRTCMPSPHMACLWYYFTVSSCLDYFYCCSTGRETEWLFSSKDGQMELTTNASFERVVIVTLGRGHTFSDMDSIKKELSTKVMELAPRRLNQNAQVIWPCRIA